MFLVLLVFLCLGCFLINAENGYLAPLILAPRQEVGIFSSHVFPSLKNHYIVHLNRELNEDFAPRSTLAILEEHRQMLLEELSQPNSQSSLDHTYDFFDFIGYSGTFDSNLLEKIRRDPAVKLVEQDQIMFAFPHTSADATENIGLPITKQFLSMTPLESSLHVLDGLVKMFKKKTLCRNQRLLSNSHHREGNLLPQNQNDNSFNSRLESILGLDFRENHSISKKKNLLKQFLPKDDVLDPLESLIEGRSLWPKLRSVYPPKKDSVINRRPKHTTCLVQKNAPWGLSRVSFNSSYDEDYVTNGTYWYPKSAGLNVDAYIVDTGINVDHEDFQGRASWGVTIPQFDLDIDGNGHGTHCAGIVGGNTYGIAKNVSLIAVKVLRTNGFGTNSDVIKGIEWVFNQHRIAKRSGRRSVINLSLGGGRSIALERAIDSCVDAGIHVAVAAGNDNQDACNYSPAASKRAITVGASTKKDKMAYFSNIGPCVDIFAPGMDITSTWIGSNSAINTISGTSMASPHVAGVLALHLGEKPYHPSELKELLLRTAVDGVIKLLPPDTINKLLSTDALLSAIDSDAPLTKTEPNLDLFAF